MNTIVKWGVGLGLFVIVVVCVLNMLGLNDVVLDAGEAIRPALTRSQDSKRSRKNPKSDYASQTLGWDILDINKKPIEVVKEGRERVLKVIDRLNEVKLKNETDIGETLTGSTKDLKRIERLKKSIKACKAYMNDASSTYPAKVNGKMYGSKKQMMEATAMSIKVCEKLERASTMKFNTGVYGNTLNVSIEKQLAMAYEILELLDARLALAEIQKHSSDFDKINKEFLSLESQAKVVFKDGQRIVDALPDDYTNTDDWHESVVNSYDVD